MDFKSLLGFEEKLAGKRIFITGHTGFTGSWACLWLDAIGAKIAGYSLPPETTPYLYSGLKLKNKPFSEIGDVRNFSQLNDAVSRFKPDLILHLAAEPLVRRSYREPVSTFAVNTMGTVHILEAARLTPSVKGIVCITTDKVYKICGNHPAYKESDPLGGKDPYSASKAAAEMVIESYRASFGKVDGSGLAIAAARGGNIIGGGDWSEDRLVPDFVRAIVSQSSLSLRYPEATRPWQHVIGLVQGYLTLMANLLERPAEVARAWNFGPLEAKGLTVREVLEVLCENWKQVDVNYMDNPLSEVQVLGLDSSAARDALAWLPAWGTRQAIAETANWYREYYKNPQSAHELSLSQLEAWRAVLATHPH
jgi:CDP-glucose 4,6-dehydratase